MGNLTMEQNIKFGKIITVFIFFLHLPYQPFDLSQLFIRAALGRERCQFRFQDATRFSQREE
jgi:hypothetical protein